jgi:hypothetical protein
MSWDVLNIYQKCGEARKSVAKKTQFAVGFSAEWHRNGSLSASELARSCSKE